MKVLVIRDRGSGATSAMAIPAKGFDEYVMRRIATVIDSYGHDKIMMKSDGERPIVALKEAVKIFRSNADGKETLLEESPKGESQSNGAAERTVQVVEGMIRTWKDAIEAKINATISTTSVMMPYIVQHAGAVITRCKLGQDGMTPYQRLRGKKASSKMVPLGEKVLYMPLKDSRERVNKLDPRFKYGIWAGASERTGEFLIFTSGGAR